MMRAPSIMFASFVLAASLSACASGDETATETPGGGPSPATSSPVAAPTAAAPALSLTDFHVKAQAACQRLQDEVAALALPTTPDEVSTYVANIYGISRRVVTTIKSLRPPAEQADAINRDFVQPLSDQLDASIALPDAVAAGDKDREEELKETATKARDRVNSYAANNDLTACVQAA